MPLVNCTECEQKISEAALSCPKCGHPCSKGEEQKDNEGLPKNLSVEQKKYIVAGILAVVIIGFIIWANSPYQQCLRDAPDWMCKLAKESAKHR